MGVKCEILVEIPFKLQAKKAYDTFLTKTRSLKQ